MPEKSKLSELTERRKLLLIEADLHRNLIMMEVENLRAHVADLESARQRVTSNPWMLAGGTIAGVFAFRHLRQLARWAPVAITAFQWFKSATKR